jgi:hypothetical protein
MLFTKAELERLPAQYDIVTDDKNELIIYQLLTEEDFRNNNIVGFTETWNRILSDMSIRFEFYKQTDTEYAITCCTFFGSGKIISCKQSLIVRSEIQLAKELGKSLPPEKFDWVSKKSEIDAFTFPSDLWGICLHTQLKESSHFIDLIYGGQHSLWILHDAGYHFFIILTDDGVYVVEDEIYDTLQEAYDAFVYHLKTLRLTCLLGREI